MAEAARLALLIAGVLVIAVVMADAVVTTVNVSERAGRVAALVLRASRPALRAVWSGPRRSAVALAQVVTLLLGWIVGLWLGWWLVLLGPQMRFTDLVHEDRPVDAAETLAVAGSALFALGAGDVVPASTIARLLLPLAAATGLVLVTLEITYLLTLTRVAVHKHQVARMLSGLGDDPAAIVTRCWDGASFAPSARVFDELATELTLLAENQRSFPVLYELGSRDRDRTVAPGLTRVLDAVELMGAAAAPEVRLPKITHHRLLTAVDELLRSSPVSDAADVDDRPDAEVLRRLGVPRAPEHDGGRERHLRRGLRALADEEGWPLP